MFLFFYIKGIISIMCQFTENKKLKFMRYNKLISVLVILIISMNLASCANGSSAVDNMDPNAPDRDNTPVALKTKAPGEKVLAADGAIIDYSNANQGYIMAQYKGDSSKVKLQVTFEDKIYNYDLKTDGGWESFPLSLGNGKYSAGIFENISGETYSQLVKDSFSVKLRDEFKPFLYPNQYVNFTKKNNAVSLSSEICAGSKSDLAAIELMFKYVVDNIEYDMAKAQSVQPGYLPNIDETLATKKGICFDYASVMSAMLRAQRIPCKLVIGYSETAYHAWISVYTKETGWVDNMIEFHSDEWNRMDPTFAASGDNSDPNIVGDGNKYNPQYYY
jgi:hypothetical protein